MLHHPRVIWPQRARTRFVMEIQRFLHRLLAHERVRLVLKAVTPARYRRSVRSWLSSDAEGQWCRVVMNREIGQFIRSLDCPRIDALEISGSGSKGRYNFRSYQAVQYPEYDICEGPLAQ